MIQIGSTTINTINIGSTTPQRIDWGSDQVWPSGSSPTSNIQLSISNINVDSGSSYFTIDVTANTTSWTVDSSDSWLTPSKLTNSLTRVNYSANGSSERTGTVNFRINGTVYATCTVRQAPAYTPTPSGEYVFLEDTANPLLIGSGQTSFTISLFSKRGSTPLRPIWIVDDVDMLIGLDSVSSASTGLWTFNWTCTQNTTRIIRMSQITFTQPESGNEIVYDVTQSRGYGKPQPSSGGTIEI